MNVARCIRARVPTQKVTRIVFPDGRAERIGVGTGFHNNGRRVAERSARCRAARRERRGTGDTPDPDRLTRPALSATPAGPPLHVASAGKNRLICCLLSAAVT